MAAKAILPSPRNSNGGLGMVRLFLTSLVLTIIGAGFAPIAHATDPVIVSGALVVPPAGGAYDDPPPLDGAVGLYLAAETDDQTAEDTLIASVGTNANGTFSLAAANTPQLASAAATNDGFVNLDLVANVNGWVYHEPIVRQYVNGAWLDENGVVSPTLELYANNATSSDRFILGAGGGTGGSKAYGGGVRYRFPIGSTRAWTSVGELHNASDVDSSSFTYGFRADSHISKAFSLDGNTWRLKGTLKIGNETDEGSSGEVGLAVPNDNWGRELESEFIYTKYRVEFWCCAPFPVYIGEDYEIRPRKWVGSLRAGSDLSHLDHRCLEDHSSYYATYPANGRFSRQTNRYHTFSNAASVTIGGATVSLGARSGLSRWVKVEWQFGNAISTHYLCGTDAFPPEAKRIFAGA